MNNDEAEKTKHIYYTIFNVAEVFIYPDPFTLSQFTSPAGHEAMGAVLEQLYNEGHPKDTIEEASRLAIADAITDGMLGRALREGYQPDA